MLTKSPAQIEFETEYITAPEIAKELDVTRAAVHYARQRGDLPEAISVGGIVYIWKRDACRSHIDAWKIRTDERKGIAA